MITSKELFADFPKHIEDYKNNLFSKFYERMIADYCKQGFDSYGQPYEVYYVSRDGEFWSNKEIVFIGKRLQELGYFVFYEYNVSDPTVIDVMKIQLKPFLQIR